MLWKGKKEEGRRGAEQRYSRLVCLLLVIRCAAARGEGEATLSESVRTLVNFFIKNFLFFFF